MLGSRLDRTLKDCRGNQCDGQQDGKSAAVFSVRRQFAVVKKRNVKNKNKKRFQKKLSQPFRLGELKLHCLI